MGKWMEQHIALRKSLGFVYRAVEYTLDAFDQHLAKHFTNCKTIVREMVSVHGVRKLFQKRWSVFERASLPHE
jgi:hypothetical protein